LLATIAELLDALIHVTVKANFKNPKLPQPLRIRRPGAGDPTPSMSLGQMARQMLAG
jgi:hypothetical protein